MNLIHLPTLDGSAEAAVARLDAIGRLQDTDAVEDGIWQAQSIVDEVVDLVTTIGGRGDAERLRSEHEIVLTGVQHGVDRLVSS